MSRIASLPLCCAALALACATVEPNGGSSFGEGAGAQDGEPGGTGSENDGADGGGSDDGGDDGGDDGEGEGDDTHFDVGPGTGGPGDEPTGCEKVDFLFIVDDSGSMGDEQQNLVQSFPGFISTIQDTLEAQDYHVMVVTTGEGPQPDAVLCNDGVCFGCVPEPFCCWTLCNDLIDLGNVDPLQECGGSSCSEWQLPSMCDVTLGGSRATDNTYTDCGFVDGKRYMTQAQPDLAGAFGCVAQRGWNGDDNERAMEAMMNAVGAEAAAGGCNEGFLRDDAILVVTYITDEEDASSPGDPALWKEKLVEAKNGDEAAVVVLGLVGDTDLPGAVCQPMVDNVGADAAPRLRQLAESFTYGQWCSVCSADYTPCFEQAVSIIDTSCDEFEPPG